jgi:hypothetical protein
MNARASFHRNLRSHWTVAHHTTNGAQAHCRAAFYRNSLAAAQPITFISNHLRFIICATLKFMAELVAMLYLN